MVLVDDYIIAIGAGVITAGIVVLLVLLARYRRLVSESKESAELAKNVWDSMNSRLAVMDTRIIDLMAKVEVYSIHGKTTTTAGAIGATLEPRPTDVNLQNRVQSQAPSAFPAIRSTVREAAVLETEVQILRVLAEGSRTSNQIKDVVGKSREHTARLMKTLFERGLVIRNDRNKPYVYEITEGGRRYLSGA